MKRVHLMIRGSVHGVFFRHLTKKKAKELGLVGMVRNVPLGVEVIAQGPDKKIDELVEFCRKGSPSANVTDVKVVEESAKDDFKDFSVKYMWRS